MRNKKCKDFLSTRCKPVGKRGLRYSARVGGWVSRRGGLASLALSHTLSKKWQQPVVAKGAAVRLAILIDEQREWHKQLNASCG